MNKFIIAVLLIGVAVCSNDFLEIDKKFKPLSQEMIDHINSVQSSWVAGPAFEGKDIEHVKSLCGTFMETPEHLRLPLKETQIANGIPEEFDSRTAWPQCESIAEVRDQSNCGSCWAFGAVTAMSDRICVASNQTLQTRLSATDLLSCCGFFTCGMGCNGGYPSGAWKYWVNSGIVTGDLYGNNNYCSPYPLKPCDHHVNGTYGPCDGDASTPSCPNTCVNGADFKSDKHFGASHYSVSSSVEAIQTEIMTHGPVEAAFTVYEDFPTYKSGVYQYTTGSQLGGHAIRIIGWGVENGTPYWTVVNSWNEGWGDNGRFKIRRGNNECGIEGQVVAGLPKL